MLDRAARIDPTKVDVEGSDVELFIGSQSVVAFALVKQLGFRTASLLLSSAEGDELDRLSFDRFQQTRKGASSALGTERFFRASAALGAGTIPVGTILRTQGSVEYVTLTVANFGLGQLDGATAFVQATSAGKSTQVGANTITQIANVQSLFDPTIQCNNDAPTAGGEDAEDDDTFRNRIRNFWRTARRGILAAIEFGALQVPGVVSAMAVEALTSGALPARIVNLYIADSSGVASDALAATVRASLDDFRAAGIAVLIANSLPELVQIRLALTFSANVDTVTLSDNVRSAVVEFVNSLPVNGTLYLGQLFSVLQRFAGDGLIPKLSSIVAPAGDLVPTLGSTLRCRLQDVTISIVS